MGKRIFLVVEKMNELKLIAKMAKQLNVKPISAYVSSWLRREAASGKIRAGDASKFGLSSSELLERSTSWQAKVCRIA